MKSRGQAIIVPALCMTAMLCSSAWPDAADAKREDELKAAYLLNFVKFVEWPAIADDTITLCFVGGDGIQSALATGIASRKIAHPALLVRRVERTQDVAGCSLLYLDAATMPSKRGVFRNAAAASVLTVSNAGEFIRSGGMIELFTEYNRLRFNINLDYIQRAGLRVSSSLLELAASVEKAEPQ